MDDNLTFEDWYEGLTTREQSLMRRGVRTLVSRTFIVREKERELYGFFSRNAAHMEDYFAPMGYTMFVEADYGIIMLRDRQEEKVDSKEVAAINKKTFTIRESVIYCALAWLYMEKMGNGLDRSILIRPDELTRALEQFGIGAGFKTDFNKTQISDALKTLQRFSLVNVNGAVGDEDCVIALYPTLLFGLDINEMKSLIDTKKDSYVNYYSQAPSSADDDNEEESIEEDSDE